MDDRLACPPGGARGDRGDRIVRRGNEDHLGLRRYVVEAPKRGAARDSRGESHRGAEAPAGDGHHGVARLGEAPGQGPTDHSRADKTDRRLVAGGGRHGAVHQGRSRTAGTPQREVASVIARTMAMLTA